MIELIFIITLATMATCPEVETETEVKPLEYKPITIWSDVG